MKYFLFALSLIASLAGGQSTGPVGSPGSVQGRVTNSQTGDGIGGTSLHLFPRRVAQRAGQPVSTVSLDDGSFQFDSVAPGAYVLLVSNSNYSHQNSAQTITVNDGQQVGNISIHLNPLGSLSGTVLDDTGKPVSKASVQLFSSFNLRGRFQLRQRNQTTADESGRYRFERLIAGRYYLAADTIAPARLGRHSRQTDLAKQPALPLKAVPGQPSLVRTFFPKSVSLEGASPIEITPGGSLDSTVVHMQRALLFSIHGQIGSLQPGELGNMTMLTLSPRDALPQAGLGRSVSMQKDGSFAIDRVPSGSYTLWLTGSYTGSRESNRRIGRRRLLAREDVEIVGSDLNDLSLSPLPPVNLTGKVVVQDSPTNTTLTQLRVMLQPEGEGALGGLQTIAPDSSGAFAVSDLDPGDYSVRVINAPAGMYVQSITLNRQDVKSTGLDLSQGGGGELQITLRSGASEVAGTLSTSGFGKPDSGTALLIPADLSVVAPTILSGAISSAGTFVIRNVPPGHYLAFAVTQWSSIWQNPDFRQEMQREGTAVAVPENGRAQVDVSLLPIDQLQLAASRLGLSVQ